MNSASWNHLVYLRRASNACHRDMVIKIPGAYGSQEEAGQGMTSGPSCSKVGSLYLGNKSLYFITIIGNTKTFWGILSDSCVEIPQCMHTVGDDPNQGNQRRGRWFHFPASFSFTSKLASLSTEGITDFQKKAKLQNTRPTYLHKNNQIGRAHVWTPVTL